MLNQLQTNNIPNQSYQDGQIWNQLGGKTGELILAELHGKFYTQCYRGNVFSGSMAAAGVALPAAAATAQVFMVWNPSGSGKNIVPIRCTVGVASGGPTTSSNIGYSYVLNTGNTVATGAPIAAGTFVTPVPMLIGGGGVSIAKFANSTATLTSAASYLRTMGVSQCALTIGATAAPMWMATEDFDGQLIIAPGSALCVTGNIASVILFTVSMTWEEVPI